MDSGDESYDDPMSTEILEDIPDRSQSHMKLSQREVCYKIRDHIKKRQLEWKGKLKAKRNMGKSLHTVFKTVVK